jgi:CrcB protein
VKPILVIFLGGGIGSVCRYLAGLSITRHFPGAYPFPAGTFVVNITGCFLIGLLYGIGLRHSWFTVDWRLFLITGICGGYTTFSTFSNEAILLIRQGNYLYFLLYITLSVVVGLLATVGGTALAR